MKKLLSKFIAIALISVLFAAPTTTMAATAASTPVLIYSDGDSKIYQYQPTPLAVAAGNATNLLDVTGPNSNGFWSVPAGKEFLFHLDSPGTFEVFIYQEGLGIVFDRVVSSGEGCWIPAMAKDVKYGVWVRAIDNLSISAYYADIY